MTGKLLGHPGARCLIGFTSREAQSITLAGLAGVRLRCHLVIPTKAGTYGRDRSQPSPGRQGNITSFSVKLRNLIFETVHYRSLIRGFRRRPGPIGPGSANSRSDSHGFFMPVSRYWRFRRDDVAPETFYDQIR